MKVVKLNDAEFREALLGLRKRGGVHQKAAEEAARMITHFDLNISEAHQVTNHGESRIKHCVKYDLPGFCRLVTVQNEGVIYVLFIGDHESVDRWLDSHEGLTLSCDLDTMRVKVVHVNRVVHEWKQPDTTNYTEANEPYFKRIPDFELASLIPEPALQKQLIRLHEGSSDEEVQEAFELVELKHSDITRYLEDYRIDASRYLREEFTLVRSAFSAPERTQQYANFDRAGRSVPLLPKLRADVLRLLLFYEEYMLAGGVLDVLGLTQSVLPLSREIRALPPEKRFRCLLVDEFQDFSTLDLRVLQLIPTAEENGLFLAGDTVQKILVKRLKLTEVGLERGNAKHIQIRKNYRNSRQILKAAGKLANTYGKIAGKNGEEIEVLDPELAVRETTLPTVLKTNHQIKKAWEVARECMSDGKTQAWTICIVTANPDKIPIREILRFKPSDVRAEELTGDYIRKPEVMVVSTLNDVKGFEFNMVLVVGCNEGDCPAAGVPQDEVWRDALRLYVAMTRARDQVFLFFDSAPSPFLESMRDELRWDEEDVKQDYEPTHVDGNKSSGGLSETAKRRITQLLAQPAESEDNCKRWFSDTSLEVLRLFFRTQVRRELGKADTRGLSGRALNAMTVTQEKEFEEWLTPRNMARLRASQFFRLRNVGRKRLQPLENDLRAVGIVGFMKT